MTTHVISYGLHKLAQASFRALANRRQRKQCKLLVASDLAVAEITALVPPGETFLLIDNFWLSPDQISGRCALPFLERDGQYWGEPEDDDTAIRELERLRQAGVGHVVFGWPAFWWFDHYAGFHRYLRSRFACVLENKRFVIFDVRAARPVPTRQIWQALWARRWIQWKEKIWWAFYAASHARGWADWDPLVPEEAFCDCIRQALRKLQESERSEQFGDYLEFGVSRGTSLASMHQMLKAEGLSQVRLFGFDSFEGLPPEAADEGWQPSHYRSTLPATRRYLTEAGVDWGRVTLVKGWFKDTLNDTTRDRLSITKASLIMVDCDLYSASRDALWFSEPLIKDRAILLFDDWGSAKKGSIGQREAFDEFLAAFPDLSANPLRAYSPNARVFLVTRGTQHASGK